MKHEQLTAEIKVRVPPWLKKALEDISMREDIAVSNVIRRALKNCATGQNRQPMMTAV